MQEADKVKFTILSRIINGDDVDDIAATEGVAKGKVLRHKREYDEASRNNNVNDLMNMDQAMLQSLSDQALLSVPEGLQVAASEGLANVKQMKDIGEALQEDFQNTALLVTKRVRAMLNGTTMVSDVESLASTLCNLQSAFFNKNQTQVNVQNNYGERKYNSFLSDRPGQTTQESED